jgi:hypothetical protein
MKIDTYLHLYIGADTNFGKLVGINQDTCFLLSENGKIDQRSISGSNTVKPLLKRINKLTPEQSIELNKRGLSIGRPKGYSFAPDAFLYLLGIRVDLFGLIDNELAIEMDSK